MISIFQNESSEAVLLVDASNAFNNLNRQVALRNIQHLCPTLSTILTNTYQCRADPKLFIDGQTLYSCEGTTQGDPLAMAVYAIGVMPLINKIYTPMNLNRRGLQMMQRPVVKLMSFLGGIRTSRSMAKTTTTAYKRLASLLADKHDQPYSTVMAWLRINLSFSLLRSAITCLRGARSSAGHAAREALPMDLAIHEGRVPLNTNIFFIISYLCLLSFIHIL